jgi:two-component system osmolarity sensor histidine kinase EnvZ
MRLGPNLKHYLPRRLFARTFLIIFIPLLLAQAAAGWVFYDRHHLSVTARMAGAVAGEVSLVLAELRERAPANRDVVFVRARAATGLDVSHHTGTRPDGVEAGDLLRRALADELTARGVTSVTFGAWQNVDGIAVVPLYVADDGGYLQILIPERRLYTATTAVFIGWMVGSALLLLIVSLIFMRNQIRPIHRLAEAAEKFGKGLEVESFKPEGAREVRQAAAAFQVMRNRLRRMIEQRTGMLAAISHDLRTPLTRMRLQLALLPQTPDTDELTKDILEMESMIETYLAFARGEESERPQEFDVVALAGEFARIPLVAGKPLHWAAPEDAENGAVMLTARPQAIRRALGNLLTNAARYGSAVWLSVVPGEYIVEIVVDDDGPGIPEEARERVFKPFFQMDPDKTHGKPKGAAGLGLTITRDIARAHGGDVMLTDSPHGGLRATLRLPL